MKHTLHSIKEFLRYQQKAKTQYYLHSPFVYQFYLHVLMGARPIPAKPVTELHHKLSRNYDKIMIEDMGAEPGSKQRLVAEVAKRACMPEHYGRALHRLVAYFQPSTILELGTCLGIGTAYMATAAPHARIFTIEGSEALSDLAKRNFEGLGLSNIEQSLGNFDQRLPEILSDMQPYLTFIDGNHRYEPTIRYFEMLMKNAGEGTILIFDDIHWSPEMTRVWTEIKAHPRINLTLDIFRLGIAFILPEKLAKEDFILRY